MDLPGDVLHDVLRRVPPRHLAACRRVSKSWRAAIDGRRLVLAHLAPRPLRGIFINFYGKPTPSFFSRGAPASPSIGSKLRFLPGWWMSNCSRVLDHSNGLVLYSDDNAMYVCNPATRRWAAVPPPSVPLYSPCVHLVSDPTVSLHYHLLYFPDMPDDEPEPPSRPRKILGKRASSGKLVQACDCVDTENCEHEVSTVGSTEWPPRSYAVQVFSSRTGQWEERSFIREGDAAGTVCDAWLDECAPSKWGNLRCHAVYFQGVFYLHCPGGFLIRLSLQEDKYQVIKFPVMRQPRPRTHVIDGHIMPRGYLRRSQHGVYYTIVQGYKLSVWVLCEATETRALEWELKHQADLELSFLRHYNHGIGKSWILDPCEEEPNECGWDSSDKSVIDVGKGEFEKEGCIKFYGIDLLGYHPHKEIAFLGNRFNGFAYYLGTSKLEFLGPLRPTDLSHLPDAAPTLESFIYTPCMDDLFPAHHEHVLFHN